MATAEVPFTNPVEDSVPKVDNAVAVGEDLEFQRRWWRFEHVVWTLFTLILIADAIGLLGRGWLSKAQRTAPDGTLAVKYERIERASTPSIMSISLGPNAIQNGEAQLFVSQSVVKELGAQRVVPQPARSVVGDNGITYTFPVTRLPAVIDVELEPSFPGLQHFRLQVAGGTPVDASVFIVP